METVGRMQQIESTTNNVDHKKPCLKVAKCFCTLSQGKLCKYLFTFNQLEGFCKNTWALLCFCFVFTFLNCNILGFHPLFLSPGGGVHLGILGRGVPPSSPNPDPISDQNIPFSTMDQSELEANS